MRRNIIIITITTTTIIIIIVMMIIILPNYFLEILISRPHNYEIFYLKSKLKCPDQFVQKPAISFESQLLIIRFIKYISCGNQHGCLLR